jgi:hypothetical protein
LKARKKRYKRCDFRQKSPFTDEGRRKLKEEKILEPSEKNRQKFMDQSINLGCTSKKMSRHGKKKQSDK